MLIIMIVTNYFKNPLKIISKIIKTLALKDQRNYPYPKSNS